MMRKGKIKLRQSDLLVRIKPLNQFSLGNYSRGPWTFKVLTKAYLPSSNRALILKKFSQEFSLNSHCTLPSLPIASFTSNEDFPLWHQF